MKKSTIIKSVVGVAVGAAVVGVGVKLAVDAINKKRLEETEVEVIDLDQLQQAQQLEKVEQE